MSNVTARDTAQAVIETWLNACQHRETLTVQPDYCAWSYARDARHYGTMELIDDPELSQEAQTFAMTVILDLPPIRTVEEAYLIFSLSEWLHGITVVTKDFGNEAAALALQFKCDYSTLTEATLNQAFQALLKAKKFFETA